MESARVETANAILPDPVVERGEGAPEALSAGAALARAVAGQAAGATTTPANGESVPVATTGMSPALKQAAVRSSMWTLTAFAAAQVIRFAGVFVIQAFLIPEDFGIAKTVGIYIVLLAALSDVGIEQAIIQSKRGDDPVFLNTAWTLHVLRGAFLWVGACALAFPVYWLYRDKADARYLLWMFPVAGLGSMLSGFNSTAIFTLHRHLRQGRLTLFGLLHQVVAVAVQLVVAWRWRSPWAIIVAGLAANAFYLLVSHLLIRGYRNRFHWDKTVAAELMRFGKWIMISTLITYLALQIDAAMIPKLLNFHWAGLYGIALTLVAMPREVVARLATVSLFPMLSRSAETNPREIGRVLLRARGLILTVSLALTLGVVLVAPVFVKLFFKGEFHQAGWLAQLASIGGWIILLQVTADRALLAQGKTKPLAVSNAVNLAVTVVAALLGRWIDIHLLHHADGIVGFMLGLAAGKLAGHMMIQIELARGGISVFRQDAGYSALLLGLSTIGVAGPRAFSQYKGHEMFYEAIAAATVCGLVCAWAGIRVLKGIR